MNPFYRISLFLWILLRSLPLISRGRLLMPVIFAGSWTLLVALQVSQPTAFVWSAMLAQTAHLYAALPGMASKARRGSLGTRVGLWFAIALYIPLCALQIWLDDPVFTQRLITAYCGIYMGVMLLGLSGDKAVLDHATPVQDASDVPLEFRRHLLRLYALTAFLVIVVNENLLASNLPLGTRVVVLSLLPVLLHYLFEIMLRLSAPLRGR